jgi:cyclase
VARHALAEQKIAPLEWRAPSASSDHLAHLGQHLAPIDRDGTKAGFDCDLTAAVSDAVNIPVIASGGAGTFEHFADVFTSGHADAALAASIFHFNEKSVSDLKHFLQRSGVPIRI